MAVLGGTDAIQEALSKSRDRDIIAKWGSFLEPDPIHSDMCVSGAGGTAQREKHLPHRHKDMRLLPRARVFLELITGTAYNPAGARRDRQVPGVTGKSASLPGELEPAGEPVSAKWWLLRSGP